MMKKKIIIISRLKSATTKIVIILGYWHTNGDIPFFFVTTAIRYFLGYLAVLGYVGYPIFILPQRQYYRILVFWDIPILIRHI